MASGRRQYPFHLIEPKWQCAWEAQQTFRAWNPGEKIPPSHPFARRHRLAEKPATAAELPRKFYLLDMFPYPSGAGLHVGHPEGYTATDILARYRRALGFNVLHPMGWDAFGLPAEQYAVKTGQHPRQATEANVANFKRQIKSLGFSYDWTREVNTTDPGYFRWTQWIFLQIYNAWFNPATNRAEPISTLRPLVERVVSDAQARKPSPEMPLPALHLELLWHADRLLRQGVDVDCTLRYLIDSQRLAYVAEMPVWWCEELGTVLANEEVVDGKSEVGGFPVVRKPMRQWMLRITAYAERLLQDLDTIEWSESLKQMQRNWIGRSEGVEIRFQVARSDAMTMENMGISVFTTRPDTLFGATYLVVAPEHPVVDYAISVEHFAAVKEYRAQVAKKSDLERTELAKEKTGVFTGLYAFNPVTSQRIPIWIADYVLASYGTGAIMAVPGHDTRDLEFAQKFNPDWIVQVVEPPAGKDWRGFVDDGVAVNSKSGDISLNGLPTPEAKRKITAWLESKGLGKRTINYKLRDWLFSRQRYWGEPFPIVWKHDAQDHLYHEALPESALPLLPPELTDYKPTASGEPPLARAQDWVNRPDGSQRETNTMPQWAGSCWYYLRYLDAKNDAAFVSREAENYWMGGASSQRRDQSPRRADATPGVDLYVGGTEHAVLHLLYARFWHKVLYDLGHVSTPEPFFKLVNQGLILGEDGQKMSKSRGNVINPDDILKEYGADAFRLYEMFMGPLEMVKPWNTQGVEGVYRFLGRVWRLFVDEQSETEFEQNCTAEPGRAREFLEKVQLSTAIKEVDPTRAQLKTLHACIKKVTEDLDGLRFNTAISALMVFVNEAIAWDVRPLAVVRDFLILLQPFAPHLAEELWAKLSKGQRPQSKATPAADTETTLDVGPGTLDLAYQPWPKFDPALLVEDTLEIPVQVNGKLRDVIRVPAAATDDEIKAVALKAEKAQPFLAGKQVKKVIFVPKKLVNIVVGA